MPSAYFRLTSVSIFLCCAAQAFQMLVRQILVKNEAEVDHWRQALLEALGPNG